MNKMNRKSGIIDVLYANRCMTLEQIADSNVFDNIKNLEDKKKKARLYMNQFYKEKRVDKAKSSDFRNQFYYWQDKKPGRWEQILWVNEVSRIVPAKEKVLLHEYTFGNLIMDGLLGFKRAGKPYLFAIEIDSANNAFDKVEKYENELKKGDYKESLGMFPVVVIVTHRYKTIQKILSSYNGEIKFVLLRFSELSWEGLDERIKCLGINDDERDSQEVLVR